MNHFDLALALENSKASECWFFKFVVGNHKTGGSARPEVIAGNRQSCAGTRAKHWRVEGWKRHLALNLRIDDVKEAGDL